jgi:hypothetical protein
VPAVTRKPAVATGVQSSGVTPMSVRIGNVLHQLRGYVQPHVKYVITQTYEHHALEGESDDSDAQSVHIKSQAVRIQRGEQLDRVTALLPENR